LSQKGQSNLSARVHPRPSTSSRVLFFFSEWLCSPLFRSAKNLPCRARSRDSFPGERLPLGQSPSPILRGRTVLCCRFLVLAQANFVFSVDCFISPSFLQFQTWEDAVRCATTDLLLPFSRKYLSSCHTMIILACSKCKVPRFSIPRETETPSLSSRIDLFFPPLFRAALPVFFFSQFISWGRRR